MALAAEALLKLRAVFDGQGFDRARQALGAIDKEAGRARRSFKDVIDSPAWQGAAVAATGIGAGLVYSAKKAIELETQMVQVRKVVEFDSPNGLKKLTQDLVDLSTKIPYTAKELGELAAAAGQAGYAEKDILKFVNAAATMGTAFNMSAKDAGDAMIAFQAAMGLPLDDAIKLGDAINHLSDNMQGVVEPEALVEVTKRIGAIGVAAGLSAKDVAALGAAFLAPGTKADVAATGLKNFLKALTMGEAGSTSFRNAMDRLMGMPNAAQWVAKNMQIDPKGTIMKVLEQLRKVPKEFQAGLISDIFGEESKAAIQPLLTNTKLVADAFGLVADEGKFAGSMTKEFQNQLNSTEAQLKIFKNNIDAIAISLGQALLPGINGILFVLRPFLQVLSFLAQKVPGFSAAIVGLGVAFAGVVISAPFISSLMTIATALKGMGILATISGWLGAVVPWLTRLGPLFTTLGPALLTLGRIIVGIFSGPVGWATLLVSAGIALYAFRDKIAQFFAWMAPAFTQAGAVIRQTWGLFTTWLGTSLNAAVTGMRQAWGMFVTWLTTTLPGLGQAMMAGLTSIGTNFNLYVIQPIRAAVMPLLIWIGQTIAAWSLAWWNSVVSGFNLYVVAPLRMAWQGLVMWFGTTISSLQQAFTMIWSQVAIAFNTYVTVPLQTAWNSVVQMFVQGLQWLRNAFLNAWIGLAQAFGQGVVQPIQQMWAGFIQWLGNTVGNIRSFLGGMWNGLANGFSAQIIQPLLNAWSSLMSGIQSSWGNMVSALGNGARGIASALGTAFNNVISSVRSSFQSVISWVTNAVQYLRNIVNGLIGRYNAAAKKVGAPQVQGFARGGYVKGPTLAWVGEGKDSEYIIPSKKMAAASMNYLSGARGASVLRGGGILGFAKGGFVKGGGFVAERKGLYGQPLETFKDWVVQRYDPRREKTEGIYTFDRNGDLIPQLMIYNKKWNDEFSLIAESQWEENRDKIMQKLEAAEQLRQQYIKMYRTMGYTRDLAESMVGRLSSSGGGSFGGGASKRSSGFSSGGGGGGGASFRSGGGGAETKDNQIMNLQRALAYKMQSSRRQRGGFMRQDLRDIQALEIQIWKLTGGTRRFGGFATGGYVNRPTLGWIGEGGDSEYIIPSKRMAASSMAYLMGARGMGVVNPPKFANGGVVGRNTANRSANLDTLLERTGNIGGTVVVTQEPNLSTTINIQTGDVMELDGTQYVSMADYQKGLRQVQNETLALLRSSQGRRATGR